MNKITTSCTTRDITTQKTTRQLQRRNTSQMFRVVTVGIAVVSNITACVPRVEAITTATLQYNGNPVQVTTVTDTFTNIAAQIENAVWWNDHNDLDFITFAQQADTVFGETSDASYGLIGPVIAQYPDGQATNLIAYGALGGGLIVQRTDPTTSTHSYLIPAPTTPVPLSPPGGATIPTLGTLIAIIGMRRINKRKQATQYSQQQAD